MRLLDGLVRAIGHILSWGFLAIVGMMTYEVVARYGFNAPTFWAHEISGVLAAMAFLFGGAYCMVDRSHLRINLLSDALGPRFRKVSEAMSLALGAVYLGGLAYAAWSLSQKSLFRFLPDGSWAPERSGTSWNTAAPGVIKFALFAAAALFLLVILAQAWVLLRGRSPDRVSDSSD